jgi:hypothetical protein
LSRGKVFTGGDTYIFPVTLGRAVSFLEEICESASVFVITEISVSEITREPD